MKRYRYWLVLGGVFVLGFALGLNSASVIVPKPAEADRDYEALQKSYWIALGWKEAREEQLNELSARTGQPWGKPIEAKAVKP